MVQKILQIDIKKLQYFLSCLIFTKTANLKKSFPIKVPPVGIQ